MQISSANYCARAVKNARSAPGDGDYKGAGLLLMQFNWKICQFSAGVFVDKPLALFIRRGLDKYAFP